MRHNATIFLWKRFQSLLRVKCMTARALFPSACVCPPQAVLERRDRRSAFSCPPPACALKSEEAVSPYRLIRPQLPPADRSRTPEEFIQNKNQTRRNCADEPACRSGHPSIRAAAAQAGSGIFRVPGLRAACAFEAATGRRGRADRSPDHGRDAGVRSRESRRSLRPHHLLPAATDHHPHRVVGESGSL